MKTVGVIGAGQLGQMLGYAGQELGLKFVFLDPSDCPPAASVGSILRYPYDSEEGLALLADASDVVTYEFENVPSSAIRKLATSVVVNPPAEALQFAQDRLAEKTLFTSLGIPVPLFRAIDSPTELRQACQEIGMPVVLKTRRLGYDGKGQCVIRDRSDIESALAKLGDADLVAEQWIPFDREVSVIGARNNRGDVVVYPLTENEHRNGILSVSRAPAVGEAIRGIASEYLTSLMNRLEYVGALALELFVTGETLLANEFAPRVHNSGHWTIEGAETSQFENHLRAILGMPLGETTMRGHAGMLNMIGHIPARQAPLPSANYRLHNYGKEARPGRKLGHITVVADSTTQRDAEVREIAKYLNK